MDNMNLYAHQSVTISLGVENPSFALPAEPWSFRLVSGDRSMAAAHTFLGWPVYAPLREAGRPRPRERRAR